VVEAARLAPPELGSDPEKPGPKRVYNYLGFPASRKPQDEERDEQTVEYVDLPTLSAAELEQLGESERWFTALPTTKDDTYDPRRHVAWALSLFRMRLRLMQDLSALIVLGGKDDGQSWGRFAGIAEEVMIAVALDKPVYVLGGADGAARATGQLLGLDKTAPDPRRCLAPSVKAELEHALKPYAHCFEIPGEPRSPIDLAEIREFLYHRGATTAGWPWNGLDLKENRDLFGCSLADDHSDVDRAVDLILQGLSRLEWKTPARRPGS
jgi:hypothetical protein